MRDLFIINPAEAEKARKALERLEDNLIHTLDAHRLGIILFDSAGDLITCNRQWMHLYDVQFESIADYNILEDENLKKKHLWQPITTAYSGTAAVMEENHFSPEEWGKPGRGRWTEGHIIPLFETSKKENLLGTAIFLQDITDKKMTLSEIHALRQLLTDVKSRQEVICRQISDLLENTRMKSVIPRQPRIPLGDKHTAIPRREREVFEKLAEGYTVKETAHQLGLGIKSVYTYRSRLLKRLGISGDVGLALAWRELQEEAPELVLTMERKTDLSE